MQQQNLNNTNDNFFAARLAEHYKYTFKEDSYVDERFEYLANLKTSEDYRMNFEATSSRRCRAIWR